MEKELDIGDTLLKLIIKNIETDARLDTYFLFIRKMISEKTGKSEDHVSGDMQKVFVELLNIKRVESPFFEDAWREYLQDGFPDISLSK